MSVCVVKCYSSLFLHLPQALAQRHHFGQVGSSTSLVGSLRVRVEHRTSSLTCYGGEGCTGSEV